MIDKTTAVFGSAFNPPHMGHADVVEQALAVFDRVILVPSFAHAFGKTMAPFALRLAMAQALKTHSGWGERVWVSDIEQDIAVKKEPSAAIYTFDVLSALEVLEPNHAFTFIVGPDNAEPATWAKFYKAEEIDKRWGRWVAQEQKAIRSTGIRTMINNKQCPPEAHCPSIIAEQYRCFIEQEACGEN